MAGAHLVLYDGVCGLCNRFNAFLLRRDAGAVLDFASLQSAAGRAALGRFGPVPDDLTTVYVIADYRSESAALLSRSAAALFAVRALGGPWRTAALATLLPRAVRDWAYDLVARHRYRFFGRTEVCPLPAAEHRARFIDL
jgi:predicted DCC family thiol-disulfide oxidoreductase YuxK